MLFVTIIIMLVYAIRTILMCIRVTNFLTFRRTSGSKYTISLGNETNFKAKMFDSVLCNFSSKHDINKKHYVRFAFLFVQTVSYN